MTYTPLTSEAPETHGASCGATGKLVPVISTGDARWYEVTCTKCGITLSVRMGKVTGRGEAKLPPHVPAPPEAQRPIDQAKVDAQYTTRGFEVAGTGGGCDAYAITIKPLHPGIGGTLEILVTHEGGGNRPETVADPVIVGFYDNDLKSPCSGDTIITLNFANTAEAIAWLQPVLATNHR